MEVPTETISDTNTTPITIDAGGTKMTSTADNNTNSATITAPSAVINPFSSSSSSSAAASSSSASTYPSSSSSPPSSSSLLSTSNDPSNSGDFKPPPVTASLEQQDNNKPPESVLNVTTTTKTQSNQNPDAATIATTITSTTTTAVGLIVEPSQSTITKIHKVKHNSSSRLNPILIVGNDRRSRKRKPKVSWPHEEKLRSFHYFEYIPDERVNVMHRLAAEQQVNADTPPPTPNASANTVTSSSLNKVPNKAAGIIGGGSNRIDSEKCHEYTRWRPLIPIDFTPKLQSPGWNSIERTAQAERETYVLGAIDLPGQPSIIDEPDQPTKTSNSNLNESLTQIPTGGSTTLATATLKDGTVYQIIEIPANNVEGIFTEHSNMYEDDNNRLFDNQLQQPILSPFLQQPQMQMTQIQQPQIQLTPQTQQPLLQQQQQQQQQQQHHQQMQMTQIQNQPQFQLNPQIIQPQMLQPQMFQPQLQQPQLQQSQMQQPMIFFYHPQLHCFRY